MNFVLDFWFAAIVEICGGNGFSGELIGRTGWDSALTSSWIEPIVKMYVTVWVLFLEKGDV